MDRKPSSRNRKGVPGNRKDEQLEKYRHKNTGTGEKMTDDAGFKISNDRWSLRAGKRGPTLLQDFHFYRKQSRFSRERIPEKVVHARGFGLYGDFETYKSMRHVTRAHFLQETGRKTPVFCRFSTFIGSKGSKDTAVDIRGFAVKFYTQEGNYDMLSLQFPVFILADAMKFMDVTHAAKPSPITEVPQATTAHDSFWDYVVSNPESAHMVMWLMSMRGRPRSWRMMAGWPINTFWFINEQGKGTFVRFKWIPKLGVHSLLLDEANIIGGVDPDFHRRDIIEAVKKGAYPEYELGVQLIAKEDEFKFDFDILDDTKLWPEEDVPVEIIGKLTLNRLVDNFFAEEEQSSFDPATLVPGIDFTNDPVLQGRAFAYRDTDYHRLGTGNINEIPVNKPIAEVNHNNRDSYSKYRIDVDFVTYHKNSLAGNTPAETPPEEGGYAHYPEEVEGHITRERPSDSFYDYFSQARLFWNSLSPVEKQDLVETFIYHLQYVKSESVRQQNVDMWVNVDREMACVIADNIGVERPKGSNVPVTKSSPAISQLNTPHYAYTQKVGVLIGNDFNGEEVSHVLNTLQNYGVFMDIISEKLGTVTGADGTNIKVNETFTTKYPVLYDSLYVVGGSAVNQAKLNQDIKFFIQEAYKHYKPIGVATTGQSYIQASEKNNLAGVVFAENNPNFGEDFLAAIAQQRFWNRT
ncbi:catalase [Melghirimyces thermohalophilus]|uniref:Catalase n=1 Tax=Melghirimyces thermohalophilus TaxID=1236220 RepID=A0A1G6L678_9BACL|nr:catalase [Melghirimyces thermohalophilus]SDC38789.1 catalase [Melghirimyces thermohalophilus]